MDLLVQLGRQVSIIEVVSVHQVLQQHVHEPWEREEGCQQRRESASFPAALTDREYLPHATLLASPPQALPSLRHGEAEGYHSPKGTMMGQVMLYVMTTVKTHIIQA